MRKLREGWNSREVVGWGGKVFMRWTYQPTVFNTNQKCSILSYSIQCQPKVFNTKAWQGTIFEQYSWVGHTNPQWGAEDSKGAVTIPSLSPHFALLLGVFDFYHIENISNLIYFIFLSSIPTLYLLSSLFYSFLFLLLPPSTKPPSKDPWPRAPWQPHSIHSPPYMLRSTIIVDIIIISVISKWSL